MGCLDPVLCCEAVSDLWLCQQRHAGVGAAHGAVHLQVLSVSPAAPVRASAGPVYVYGGVLCMPVLVLHTSLCWCCIWLCWSLTLQHFAVSHRQRCVVNSLQSHALHEMPCCLLSGLKGSTLVFPS